HANVTTLMGPGVDPHLYQATPRDVQALQRADVILYSGLGLEGQLADVLDRFSEQTTVVAVAELGLPASSLLSDSTGYLAVDPHVWMDAALWSGVATVIADTLAGEDPASADAYHGAASSYVTELLALDSWVRQAIAT